MKNKPKFKPGDVITMAGPRYGLVLKLVPKKRAPQYFDALAFLTGKHSPYVAFIASDNYWELVTDQSIIDNIQNLYKIHLLTEVIEK